MYPSGGSGAATAAKFQNRCGSPQFASDYPHPHQHPHPQTTSVAIHTAPSTGVGGGSGSSAAMSGGGAGGGSMRSAQRAQQMTLTHGHNHGLGMGMVGHGMSSHTHSHGHGHGHGHGLGHGHGHQNAATLGHPHNHGMSHVGSHLIYPDDMDSIEFCMPAPPSSSAQNGLAGDQFLLGSGGHDEAFRYQDRWQRNYSRRSNHKMEQQVKWSRKNIAATMERFEPTPNTQSSSSTSSLDYGFAAGVMTPGSNNATPSHVGGGGAGASNPSLHVAFNGSGGAAGGSVGSGSGSIGSESGIGPGAGIGAGAGAAGGATAGAVGGTAAAAAAAPFNHVYSYAYYEPGAAKCHTNVPAQGSAGSSGSGSASVSVSGSGSGSVQMLPRQAEKSPPRNSIRALLAKSFRSKSSSTSHGHGHGHGHGQSTSSSPSAEERDRHTYTTRYGTTENLYEEVSDQKIRKVLSDNRIASASSVGNVKEEQRRVQNNHFRVLDELNLSLEALIMPPTPPDVSPNHAAGDEPNIASGAVGGGHSVSTTAVVTPLPSSAGKINQRPRRGGLLGGASNAGGASNSSSASHASLENLSSTLNSMELKDHGHSSCINPEFDEGDLDSGFSGSGSSSGASYNESLRYYKSATPTGPMHHQHQHQGLHHQGMPHHHGQHHHHQHHHSLNNNTLPHNLRSCRSSTASGTSTSKSSMASCGEDQGIGMTLSVGGVGVGVGGPGGGLPESGAGGGGGGGGSLSPFNYPRRCSADQQRASGRSIGGMAGGGIISGMGGGATTMASGSNVALSTGTKPKKNFWTMKP
ncbi:hornerin [Drosophila ananassae]|nr:hornerin [Drosophila ananassae]